MTPSNFRFLPEIGRAPDHCLASLLLSKFYSLFIQFLGIVPSLINLKLVPDRAAWLQVPGNIYIGRSCHGMKEGSMWANPFKIDNNTTREESIRRYTSMLSLDNNLHDALATLCFSKLGCWCIPLPCHGHVLIEEIKKKLLFDIEYI